MAEAVKGRRATGRDGGVEVDTIAWPDGSFTVAEVRLDVEARAAMIRSEHEATHGEAEMCGAECIELGLADFGDDDTDCMEAPL
jgi:hypothetical protein